MPPAFAPQPNRRFNADANTGPIKFIDVPLERTLHITKNFNIDAYDAYLIQCAELTSSPLLTLDQNCTGQGKPDTFI